MRRTNRFMAMCLGCQDCESESFVIGFYHSRSQANRAIHAKAGQPLINGNWTQDPCATWAIYDVHDAIGFAEFQDTAS